VLYYTTSIESPQGFFIYQKSSMNTLISYLKHVREEFTHIVWPTRHKAISHTFVVIFIAATIALLVGLLDYIFGLGVNRIIIGG
jgi:preprotein translocase SecE subunit